jgi:hypothetical protein
MRLETNRHMDEEEIERYSMGAISEEASVLLDEHLLVCEFCQKRVTESDHYVSTMHHASVQKRREDREQENHRRFLPHPVATLASIALTMLLVVVGLRLANRGNVAPAFALNLVATRGNGIEAKAPAGRALTLQLDLAGLPAASPFRLQMVDRLGKQVWQGNVISQDSKAAASVPQMADGVYFVRVFMPSGELLREYGLEVEGR